MIELAVISLALGAVLAGRFHFPILSLATLLGLIGVGIGGHFAALSWANILLAGLIYAVCLQAGFFVGALVIDRFRFFHFQKAAAPIGIGRRTH